MLCDDLEVWKGGGGGGESRGKEHIDRDLCLIHVVVQQKLIHHCKAIILQFKKRIKRNFPSGPVAKILYSQCRRPGFNSWSGN